MNRNIAGFIHVAIWAFLFLSPLTFWRGTGLTLLQYLMYSVQPLLLMFIFYLNYLYLAPKLFVEGKHRYYILINLVLVICLGIFMHNWMEFTNRIYPIRHRTPDYLDNLARTLRDCFNLAIFAATATALALARRWVTTNQKLKEMEAIRAQAELSNLRAQINPHFLLNTLNNIYALTAIDTERAQDAIQQLSKMLRHMLYDNMELEVPIEKEIAFLQNYVNLMKIRLPQTVDVTFNAPSTPLHGIKVAPLVCISLFENAFKHGVSPTEPSFIHINIEVTPVDITLNIENSNHPKTESDRSGHGIGLQQVQRRLELAYPDKYEWQHGVKDGGKTYYSYLSLTL